MAARMLKSKVESIRGRYPEKVDGIASNLKRLSSLEQENEQNIDLMAGLFGNIMAEIFAWQPDEWEASLRKIGFFLGKFIYLMDAYEDVEKDIASGSSREFEKLPILLHAEILRNVLYSGVWCRYTAVTAKRQESSESADTGCNDAENVTDSGSSSPKDTADSDRDNSDTGV